MISQERSRQVAIRTIHSVVAVFGACFIVWCIVTFAVLAMTFFRRLPMIDLDFYGHIETGSLFSLLFFGLPVQFGLQRLKLNQWWIYSLLGASFGALIGMMLDYVILHYDSEGFEEGPFVFDVFAMTCIAGGALLGAAHAWFAWLIRRPDRDTAAIPKAIKTA